MNWIDKSLVVILVLIANIGLAQELNLKIIQGSIVHNKEVVSKALELIPIKQSDHIEILQNTVVIINFEGKIIEINSGSFSYNELLVRAKKKSSSFTSEFINVVFNEDFQKQNLQVAGVATRGSSSRPPNHYSPLDDFKLIDNSLNLEIGNSTTVLLGEVFVYNKSKNDTILKDASKRIKLQNLREGSYVWGYTISYNQGTSKVKEEYLNSFIVPEKSIIEKEKVALADFKDSIKEFSVKTQHVLLKEYYHQHKIIAPYDN